ncbi:MAG: glycine zipper family protein [Janthinobacterium lividum]
MRPLPLASTALAGLFALSACAVAPPPGPTILAQPGQGKNVQQFQAEDARCKQAAAQANGGVTPSQAATRSGIGSAAIGTVLGAAAGAVLGAVVGNPGAGAAFGAGGGLLIGSASGADNAQRSGAAFQGNYDNAYAQCTISSGNMIVQPRVVGYQGPGGYGSYAPGMVPPPPPPMQPPGSGYGW